MADSKISQLTAAGALTGAEQIPVVQGGVTKRTTTGAIGVGTYAPLSLTRVAADTGPAPLNWTHNGDEKFLFHFTTGLAYSAPIASGAALVGIGIGDGDGVTKNELGIGILLSNKKSGEGMRYVNEATITSATAFGIHGLQNSMAPLVFLESTTDSVADLLTLVCNTGAPAAGQVLQRWQSIGGGGVVGFGNDCGRVYAANGRLDWFQEIRANGSKLVAHTADTNNSSLATLATSASWLEPFELRHRQYSGTPGTYWSTRFTHSPAGFANNHLLGGLQGAQAGGHAHGAEVWSTMLAFDGTRLGFYGVAPVTRAAAITSPTAPGATYVQAEAAAMKTAVDAIRTALINIGITS